MTRSELSEMLRMLYAMPHTLREKLRAQPFLSNSDYSNRFLFETPGGEHEVLLASLVKAPKNCNVIFDSTHFKPILFFK